MPFFKHFKSTNFNNAFLLTSLLNSIIITVSIFAKEQIEDSESGKKDTASFKAYLISFTITFFGYIRIFMVNAFNLWIWRRYASD